MNTKNISTFTSMVMLSLVMTACGNPEQQFAITVTDEDGKPMAGIECKAWFKKTGENSPIKDYFVTGKTDISGKIELSGETIWAPTSVEARKEGYYLSSAGGMWTKQRNGTRWEPWPVEINLVMKKIISPKPMYVVKYDNQKWHRFPNKKLGPFGFDLIEADWVHPHGEGKVADFILEAQRDKEDDSAIMPKGKVILKFGNPNDGIVFMKDSGGSVLVGPSKAPDDKEFHPEWIFENFNIYPDDPDRLNNDFSNEVYILRVRTRLDKNGNMLSAYYGKIDGRIVGWLPQTSPSIMMTYYLNGTANDRGLEWNLKNNLIRDTSRMRTPERP